MVCGSFTAEQRNLHFRPQLELSQTVERRRSQKVIVIGKTVGRGWRGKHLRMLKSTSAVNSVSRAPAPYKFRWAVNTNAITFRDMSIQVETLFLSEETFRCNAP